MQPTGKPSDATEQLLTALNDGRCYPEPPASVTVIQTHLSIVSLADDRVYKLKKAITLPFVDFAPLAARRQACRDEVRLNRRLCPDTYLGTCALLRVGDHLQFTKLGDDEDPSDLDVAVVMRRLPQERMLDVLLAANAVGTNEMVALAKRVAAFHQTAARTPEVLAHGDPDKLAGFARDNFDELAALPSQGLPTDLLQALAQKTRHAFDEQLPRLRARAAAGQVVDGHGDLHARNVCMTDPPTIYDCIEFEPAFRCGDVATEVAFLVMDLRYRRATELARTFISAYVDSSKDEELKALLPTLCSYRAMVRAKVAAIAASETELPDADREAARRSAHRHLQLASAFAIESSCSKHGPWWVLLCGPPASGKSRLCRELTDTVQWPHFATDQVRKDLAHIAPTETALASHYSEKFSQRTYDELLQRAASATAAAEPIVMLDGNFPTRRHRDQTRQAAAAAGARLLVVHIGIDLKTALARASQRMHEADSFSDADPTIAAALHAKFEPPQETEQSALLELSGRHRVADLVDEVLAALLLG